MYSAQALVDGLYTVDDLPNSILVTAGWASLRDAVFTKGIGDHIYNYNVFTIQLREYPGYDDIRWVLVIGDTLEEEVRILDDWGGACLISPGSEREGDSTGDQFANSYTIQNFSYSGPFIVDRIELCRWEKTINGTLYFGNPDNPPANGTWTSIIELLEYYFLITLIWINNDQGDFNYPNQVWQFTKLGPPTEPNSSPLGSYSAGEFGSISVS
jgi:uncharacterized integral membrane protein